MHILEHLRTVNRHRHLVRKYCFRLGLYWQGLTHDLSKYSPTEFWRSAKYYQGYRSPNDQERLVNGVSLSWLHHKGRNRHHFEYWIDYCREKLPAGGKRKLVLVSASYSQGSKKPYFSSQTST